MSTVHVQCQDNKTVNFKCFQLHLQYLGVVIKQLKSSQQYLIRWSDNSTQLQVNNIELLLIKSFNYRILLTCLVN